MSIEKMTQAKAQIEASAGYKTLLSFFDEESFCEIDTFAKSEDTFAEVVAGFGTVEGMPVYAFAQNSDMCGGAMSKAQSAKLKKLYDLALKTGAPVYGFYNSLGGRLAQGNALLSAYGEILNKASNLSGVVPQVSVVLGTCLGTGALNAVSADFVIMSKEAKLSIDVTGENQSADYCAKKGIASIVVDNEASAIEKAKELLTYLPSNNLNMAPEAFENEPNVEGKCLCCRTADAGSFFKLNADFGDGSVTALARIGGTVAGYVVTKGQALDCPSATKIAKFVRFCDAFSIPVISFVNSTGFESIKSAAKVSSAYAEATTVKISVVTGTAVGSVYVAMAGTGANTDLTFALPEAVISPINVEAAAVIMAPEVMNVPVAEQKSVAEKFAKENLGAFTAAENGYVEDIVTEENLRAKLISALDMLSGKRVPTLAKKHSTI